jgi:hypothetical protein
MQMSNPIQAWNTWCALSLQAARLGWEAQSVIALRMMRLATQSAGSQAEARRMVTEKVAALAEAQTAAAGAAIKGGTDHHVVKKVLGVYKKRVRANRRRLKRAQLGATAAKPGVLLNRITTGHATFLPCQVICLMSVIRGRAD